MCQVNELESSGTLTGTASNFLVDFDSYSIPAAMAVSEVKEYVLANAGVGIV